MFLTAVFAIVSAFFHSLHTVANKFIVARSQMRALEASLLIQLTAGVLTFPLLIALQVHWVRSTTGDILGIAALSAFGFVLSIMSLSIEDASVVAPVLGLKVLFLAILESIVKAHPVSTGVIIGAVLSVAGLTLMSQTDRWTLRPALLFRPGMLLMAIAALSFAFSDILIGKSIPYWPSKWYFTLYLVTIVAAMSLFMLLVIPVIRGIGNRRRQYMQGMPAPDSVVDAPFTGQQFRRALLPLLASAVCSIGAQFFLFTSFDLGHQVTLTNILYNTRSLFVIVLMAILVLGRGNTVERAGKRAYTFRFAGVILILAATVCALLL